jgi:hypothetical protein
LSLVSLGFDAQILADLPNVVDGGGGTKLNRVEKASQYLPNTPETLAAAFSEILGSKLQVFRGPGRISTSSQNDMLKMCRMV